MAGIALQFGFFVVAGVMTTLLDFAVYNLLTRPPLRWPRIRSNCVSVTAAICFSFTVNLLFVFRPEDAAVVTRATRFLLVTMFSAYVLQNLVIYLTSKLWLAPADLAVSFSRRLAATRSWSEEFVRRNAVKVCAVAVGLIWNFFWYRYFVFSE